MSLRCAALVVWGFGIGCATVHPVAPTFGPEVDDSLPAGVKLSTGEFSINGDELPSYNGCAATVGRWSTIVRCPGAGHLSWTWPHDPGDDSSWTPGWYIEVRDLIESALVAFARKHHDSVKKLDYPCEVASSPGTCRGYLLAGTDGTRIDVVGVSTVNSFLVECFTGPGGARVMLPLCHEVIQAKPVAPKD